MSHQYLPKVESAKSNQKKHQHYTKNKLEANDIEPNIGIIRWSQGIIIAFSIGKCNEWYEH